MTNDDQLQEYKSYVRFTDDDEQNLRALAPTAIPLIPDIINSFYEALLDNPAARAVFSGGDEQVERLRAILGNWLKELFVRTQDEDYILSRRRIGKIHLEIGLPQRFMILGIDLMWQGICMTLRNAASKDPQLEQKLDSLHKRLTIDQAIMLESYKQLDATRIRRAERDALKEQLTRAEHLAEVGQLAASLAHEIKNPLTPMKLGIQQLERRARAEGVSVKDLSDRVVALS
ncbi:MAG: protoglobin domain-containing protein, partial [Phycisphaerae bacterium]